MGNNESVYNSNNDLVSVFTVVEWFGDRPGSHVRDLGLKILD